MSGQSGAKLMMRSRWCDLHDDLCSIIIDRVDALDVLNMSATCSSWSALYSRMKYTVLQSGQPTLVTSRPDHDGSGVEEVLGEGTFGLHDVCTRKSFCIQKSFLENMFWVGGKDDWIVVSNKRCSMNLVNLLSGDIVPLPSFCTIDGVEINEEYDLEVVSSPHSHLLRRVVLCNTPSSSLGYLAIALFSDGMLSFTRNGDDIWKLFKHPTEWECSVRYFPNVYLDALVHNGRIVAVDDQGFIFSCDMVHHRQYPLAIEKPDIPAFPMCNAEVFYLAKSTLDELIVISLHGSGQMSHYLSYRMLVSEHNRFDKIAAMTMHKYDDSENTWQQIRTIGLDQSLFLGLNYPFCGIWRGLEPNTIYVAGVGDSDVMMIDMGAEAGGIPKMQDYPVEEGARLLDGFSIRTPMWFRPTRPSTK